MTRARFSRLQLTEKASLGAADVAEVNRCRRDHNRFGFAYQLGFVKLMGRLPKQNPLERLDELVAFIGVQLGMPSEVIDGYQHRRETIAEHAERIRTHLKLRRLGDDEGASLATFVLEAACRLEPATAIQAQAREFLREQGILLPSDSTLATVVAEHRERARQQIFKRLAGTIPLHLARTFNELLEVEEGQHVSGLQRIKANPSKPSADAMLKLTDKLAAIESTGVLEVELSWLSRNYQRALFHYAKQATAKQLRELSASRRLATLVCFLVQSYRDAVDQVVDMFDKLMTRTQTLAKNEIDERLKQRRKAIQKSLSALKSLGDVILDESIGPDELRDTLFEKVPREQLAEYVEDADEWVSGKSSHSFNGVAKRYSAMRKFTPALLHALRLMQDTGEDDRGPCLQALDTLKELNDTGKRKLPADATVDFVPRQLRAFVQPDGADGDIDRKAWECALLLQTRDEIRSGNVSVDHSKRFAPLDDFFMPSASWEDKRASFFERSGLPAAASDVPGFLERRLGEAYDRFLNTAPTNTFATIDDDGWHLSVDPSERLDTDAQERLDALKSWLSRNMRRINLADLLIEVDNDIGFSRCFMPPSLKLEASPDDVCTTLAAVMAHGCNIGPYTMSQLTKGVSYGQLKRVSDWQMTDDAQRAALAQLVDAISALDTSLNWGEGRTSASDGQRFALRRKVLQQTYSPKFGDFALEFYSFVADNYAPYYSSPIECTDRDAPFVLDGLLYNESELKLEEHYTDTHGYTEINFAAFAMLGRRFCPRIRGVQKQLIYRIDKGRDYGQVGSLVNRADRTIDTAIIAEQWDRMGQLYASFETGHSTASVVLKRLVGFNATNRFYRANRDLGRIFKTEFILQYMSDPALRRRVRRGLLKVEQLHALARDVHYGHRGRIHARELWEQMNSCSCLTLIVACIIYWQAKEMSRAVREAEPQASGIDLSLLQHVSPIEWDNVVLYGQYVLNRSHVRQQPRRRRKITQTTLPGIA